MEIYERILECIAILEEEERRGKCIELIRQTGLTPEDYSLLRVDPQELL